MSGGGYWIRKVADLRKIGNGALVPVIDFANMNKIFLLTIVLIGFGLASASQLRDTDVIDVVRDEVGWRLQVNGKDFYIKGVVWSYTPPGQTHTFDLWAQTDEDIKNVVDYEFGMMKSAGINAVRTFSIVPPQWVTYIYREYGIMSVINPLMGRYGAMIDGESVAFVDYSDDLTRATLKADTLEIVEQYKNVPGVLMFALGNESNYGLSWPSFEIEDLPEGEQHVAKARYLYSLFNEVILAARKIAPDHLFTIVNGDIQYIDLIAELVPELDLLGSNVYRGKSFTSLWQDVDAKLGLPVVLFEFGADAFDARERREDPAAQAMMLKHQWREMYNKAHGNGEEGNSIGGFVFEWRDEWWKYLQDRNLDTHDDNASWSNQGYLFDWEEGKNNMNEEWFGITALGPRNTDGVYTAQPRLAYEVLAEIWSLDPYELRQSELDRAVRQIDIEQH